MSKPTIEDAQNEVFTEVSQNIYSRTPLGNLVDKVIRLAFTDPNVLKPKDEVPQESLKNYHLYQRLIEEINRREEKYSAPYSPRGY